ncbi:phosphoribosylglycinamide formyltransferase [Sphingomonas sp.]|uniref:phosphoribosylglycinamide formyltransferase n=1 Tax=Sphingomonas sp. TaxID=28214 RepID=UPI00286CC798|nr:phosphoribosylglycinamide formyltransferase [Sphingomonas sp.]
MAERARVAILISGRGSNMAALIYAARADDCPYEIALVSGDKADVPGLQLAHAEGAPILALDAKLLGASYWNTLQDALDAARIDTIALAGFMRIIPAEFVARWAGKMVNIHPSLLPLHPGLRSHEAVLAAGETTTGATVHLVSDEVDSGAILGQVKVAVLPGDTPDTLATRVLIAEHQLYPRLLAEFVSRPLTASWIEQRIDELASHLPEVGRKTSHGSPGWSVGSGKTPKLFAILADHHHGEEAIGLLVKASGPDEMGGLIEAHPDVYYWPKYYGAGGWLAIKLNRRDVDWDHVAEWLERSWRACAPPRLTKLMSITEEF